MAAVTTVAGSLGGPGAGQPRGRARLLCLFTPCVWMTGRPLGSLDPRAVLSGRTFHKEGHCVGSAAWLLAHWIGGQCD